MSAGQGQLAAGSCSVAASPAANVTSVIVEALFSQYDAMKGKGNKSRSSLTDEHTLEALLTREAEDVVGDVMCRFEGAPRLGFAAAEQRLEW